MSWLSPVFYCSPTLVVQLPATKEGPRGESEEPTWVPWTDGRPAGPRIPADSEEKAAFENLTGLFVDRLRKHPHAHIYHSAAYEPAALKRPVAWLER
jgi:hypothetical protein